MLKKRKKKCFKKKKAMIVPWSNSNDDSNSEEYQEIANFYMAEDEPSEVYTHKKLSLEMVCNMVLRNFKANTKN